MPNNQRLVLEFGGVDAHALTGTLTLRSDGQSRATFALDPSNTDAEPPGGACRIVLAETKPGGGTVKTTLLGGKVPGVVVSTDYLARFEPPEPGTGGAARHERTITVQDGMWAYKDLAPGETVTRTDTDSHAELRFVGKVFGEYFGVGAISAITNIPAVPIKRIDYTREAGYWAPLFVYFAPWSPLVFVDPATSAIEVIDTTAYTGLESRPQAIMLPSDWNDLKPNASGPINVPTQFRVDYTDFGGDDTDIKGFYDDDTITVRRDSEDRVEADDGSVTVTWTDVADLHEDEDDPTRVTRSVIAGDGTTVVSADHEEISEQHTLYEYEADYTRLRRKTSIVKGRVDLPGIGETYREAERTVEEHHYEPHELLPGKYYRTWSERTTSGLYVYTYTGAENEEVDILTGTSLIESSLARTVTVDGDSQRWGDGPMRRVFEKYQRTTGSDLVTVSVVDHDLLRDRTRHTTHKTQIGDIVVGSDGFARYVYVGTGGKRAEIIDATRIGLDLGLEIANARLARLNTKTRSATLRVLRPDYTRYRYGAIAVLDPETTPWGDDVGGPYLIMGVDFTMHAGDSGEASVTQTLTLAREW